MPPLGWGKPLYKEYLSIFTSTVMRNKILSNFRNKLIYIETEEKKDKDEERGEVKRWSEVRERGRFHDMAMGEKFPANSR